MLRLRDLRQLPAARPTAEQTRRVAALYRAAVVFGLQIPPEVVVRDRDHDQRVAAYKKSLPDRQRGGERRLLRRALPGGGLRVGKLQEHLLPRQALRRAGGAEMPPLAAGPALDGGGRHRLLPLAVEFGWEIYPIGSSATAEEVPAGCSHGHRVRRLVRPVARVSWSFPYTRTGAMRNMHSTSRRTAVNSV